jgi:hypothetical protein
MVTDTQFTGLHTLDASPISLAQIRTFRGQPYLLECTFVNALNGHPPVASNRWPSGGSCVFRRTVHYVNHVSS